MCTAISFISNGLYFGRNLDYEKRYSESVVVVPRRYEFIFNSGEGSAQHYAMIGVASVVSEYPLFYDGMNETGLCIAGLNFVGNAATKEFDKDKINISPYEFIPYLLCFCKNVEECRERLSSINLINKPFRDDLPNPELHWIISDRNECITVEFVKEGMMIYDNKVGVLTNNPIFPYHIWNLSNFSYLTNKNDTKEESFIIDGISFHSRGRGSLGLPGDYTSASRFVRASFVKENSPIYDDPIASVNQCFHMLDTVAHPEGAVMIGDDYEITQYSSVCDAQNGKYYIKTYRNCQISATCMMDFDLEDNKIIKYKIPGETNILHL